MIVFVCKKIGWKRIANEQFRFAQNAPSVILTEFVSMLKMKCAHVTHHTSQALCSSPRPRRQVLLLNWLNGVEFALRGFFAYPNHFDTRLLCVCIQMGRYACVAISMGFEIHIFNLYYTNSNSIPIHWSKLHWFHSFRAFNITIIIINTSLYESFSKWAHLAPYIPTHTQNKFSHSMISSNKSPASYLFFSSSPFRSFFRVAQNTTMITMN